MIKGQMKTRKPRKRRVWERLKKARTTRKKMRARVRQEKRAKSGSQKRMAMKGKNLNALRIQHSRRVKD